MDRHLQFVCGAFTQGVDGIQIRSLFLCLWLNARRQKERHLSKPKSSHQSWSPSKILKILQILPKSSRILKIPAIPPENHFNPGHELTLINLSSNSEFTTKWGTLKDLAHTYYSKPFSVLSSGAERHVIEWDERMLTLRLRRMENWHGKLD